MADVRKAEFRTKSQIVFDELKRRIVAGVLSPGTRLLLRPIALEFECSEIPVREAFRSLEASGLVQLVPHGGARVSELCVDDLVELTEIRAMLEPAATVAGAARIDENGLRELEGMIERMAGLADDNDAEAYGRLNRRFHSTIIRHCPNRKLVGLVNDLWDRAERALLVYRKGPEFLCESLKQHAEMVRLIRTGDLDGLRDLSRAHSQFGLEAVRGLAAWDEAPARAVSGGRR
jgi:DNA-binding GntR family transcriptional regulator